MKGISIFLIIFMFTTLGGQYIEYGYSIEQSTIAALIDIVIITFIMMFVPLCFRIHNKKLLEYKKGKKICKYNSIIAFILSVILTVTLNKENTFVGVGGLGCLIYYFINMCFFVSEMDYNLKKENSENKKSISKKEEKIRKIKINYKYITIILVIILIILGSYLIYNYYNENKSKLLLNEKVDLLNSQIKELKDKQSSLEAENFNYFIQKAKYKEKADFLDENIVFVLDGYGNYYYTYDQMEIVTQGVEEFEYWAYNEEYAISKGYKAWK